MGKWHASSLLTAGWLLACTLAVQAAEDAKPSAPEKKAAAAKTPAPAAPEKTVEQLVESVKPSVVVVTFLGRNGDRQGMGTGFVISKDGLIATNLHVLGEARPIQARTADGKIHEVISVHASDRAHDLAIIRVKASNLKPLPLGDSDALQEGRPVVAIGNPLGLTYSVVTGVVSGKREIDGKPMIQLAMPIEPGNSGGPLIDLQGRVQGILTMKSLVTENLGFAVAINSLKPLLEKPNPIPLSNWLTIGALDAREWKPLFGARWSQRSGRIAVDGLGQGFGGRSLCLSQTKLPDKPFEVAVAVKLGSESGAAGLVFCSDGKDKCYGFYPSGGQLRLSRFDGPDVLSWNILEQVPSDHYLPGEWNRLKVRLESGKILCYVNDHLVIESTDAELTQGKVGLAKFRDTQAEYKSFQVATKIPPVKLPTEVVDRVSKLVNGVSVSAEPAPDLVKALTADADTSLVLLRDRAKKLEREATQLRRLATGVHYRRVQNELEALFKHKEEEIDLAHAALLVARLDNDEVDVDAYRKQFDRMATDLAAKIPKKADEEAKIKALNQYLFREQGFHGSRFDYYNRSNSYLNEVLDDREGLPITLSVIYIELARRIGVKVVGVGLPGHFVVKHVPAKGKPQLIDVFDNGKPMTDKEADTQVLAATGRPSQESDFEPSTKAQIVTRMLHNLMGLKQRQADAEGMLPYLDAMLAIAPDSASERWMRAVVCLETGRKQRAIADADWLLEKRPPEIDLERVTQLRQLLDLQSR